MLVLWIAAALVTAPIDARAGDLCVALDGDEETCRDLGAILSSRGLVLASTCATLRARVEPRGARFAVLLDDGDRTTEREVSDRRVAASLIESWARSDLTAPLFESEAVGGPRIVIAPPKEPRAAPAEAPIAAPVVVVREPASFGLVVLGGASASGDGELWYNFGARLRSEWGPIDPTLSLRMVGGGAQLDLFRSPATRIGLDAILGLDLPIDLGAVQLRPGIGIGAGLMRSARSSATREVCVSGLCEASPVIGDQFVHAGFGPRGEAHLGMALSIADSWALELDFAATYAPLAASDPLVPQYAADLPLEERLSFALPGEPSLFGHAALGLRWEAM